MCLLWQFLVVLTQKLKGKQNHKQKHTTRKIPVGYGCVLLTAQSTLMWRLSTLGYYSSKKKPLYIRLGFYKGSNSMGNLSITSF